MLTHSHPLNRTVWEARSCFERAKRRRRKDTFLGKRIRGQECRHRSAHSPSRRTAAAANRTGTVCRKEGLEQQNKKKSRV